MTTAQEKLSWPGFVGRGAISFTIVSLAGFAVWAFAGGWFYRNMGEVGLYAVSALVFIGVAGLVMPPLIVGPNRVRRFYGVFGPAFLLYAIVWSLCWFIFKGRLGEWMGSFFGSVVFALASARLLRSNHHLVVAVIVLFALHSAGYFLGGMAYMSQRNPPEFMQGLSRSQIGFIAKMLWGLLYGAGFGAGIGFVFYSFQVQAAPSATAGKES